VTRPTLTLLAIILVTSVRTSAQTRINDVNNPLSSEEQSELRRLGAPFHNWLTEDVAYIISPEERECFLGIADDWNRTSFIELFWQRRNPDPDSQDNIFEVEHYRRIAYSNDHFSTDQPGWQSDRGRMYIMWGPPDEVQDDSDQEARNGERSQIWRYRYLEGIGENVELRFVAAKLTGDYRLSEGPKRQGAFSEGGRKGVDSASLCARAVVPNLRPPARFKKLEAIAVKHVAYKDLTLKYRFDCTPVTEFTNLVPVTIEIPKAELRQSGSGGGNTGGVNLFFRARDSTGSTVEMFEAQALPNYITSAFEDCGDSLVLKKSLPLRSGSYDLAIVVSDLPSRRLGTVFAKLNVPGMTTAK
jgi:GWxTD domain-containing protein